MIRNKLKNATKRLITGLDPIYNAMDPIAQRDYEAALENGNFDDANNIYTLSAQ